MGEMETVFSYSVNVTLWVYIKSDKLGTGTISREGVLNIQILK